MDGTALIQLARELDELENRLKGLEDALQPIFERERKLQHKEEMDKKYPYGWEYRDPEHPEKGIISY